MEDNTQKTVVSITSHRANTQSRIEVDGARRCISMLSWDLQVQQALAVCGLQVSEALLGDGMALSPSSHAAQLGHTSLESLVSKSEIEDGLNLNWVDFKAKMQALVYRSKLSIEESNFSEINAMVADATKILGRMPVTAAEFHSAKQSVLQSTITTLQREGKVRLDDLQERNKDLIRDLNTEKATVHELRVSQKALMEDGQSRIQQMTRELALKQDGYESEAKQTIAIEVQKAEESYRVRLSEAQVDMERQIREAQAERREAEMTLCALTSRIEAGELVEASRLLELNLKVESARDIEHALRRQMLELNDALTQANKRVELIQNENMAKQETIDTMSAHMAMLEQRMREQVEDKLGASEFAVLHERLEIRKIELESLSGLVQKLTEDRDKGFKQRDQLQDNFSQLRGRFAEMKRQGSEYVGRQFEQIKGINVELSAMNVKYSKLSATNTQLKFVLVGVTTIAGVAGLALVMLVNNI